MKLRWLAAAAAGLAPWIGPAGAWAQDIRAEKALVLPFAATGASERDLNRFTEDLIEDLRSRGAYNVVSKDSLERALRDVPPAGVDDTLRLALAERFEATMTVHGRLGHEGSTWTAEVELAGLDPEEEPLRLPALTASGREELSDVTADRIFRSADAHRGIRLGTNFYRYQAWERALDEFNRAVQQDPELAIVHFWRGRALANMDSLAAARAAFETAARLDPRSIGARRELVQTTVAMGDTVAAREMVREMVAARPDDPALVASAGYWLAFRLGDRDAGIAELQRARTIAPEYADPYKYLALLAQDSIQRQEMAEAYLERAGRRLDVASLRAILAAMLEEGNAAAATTLLERAVSERPNETGLHFILGFVYQRGARPEEAIAEYTRVVEADTTFARNNQVYLYRALAYGELDRTAEMEADLARIGTPSDPAAVARSILGLADTALREGRCAEALQAVEAAERFAPSADGVAFYRGIAIICLAEARYGENASVATNREALADFQSARAAFEQSAASPTYGAAATEQIDRTDQLIRRTEVIIQNQTRRGR